MRSWSRDCSSRSFSIVGFDRLAQPRADLLEPRQQGASLGDTFLDVAAHVLRRIELRLLRQVADPQAGRRKRLTQEVRRRP